MRRLIVLFVALVVPGVCSAFPCPPGFYNVYGGDLPYRVAIPPSDTAGVELGPYPFPVNGMGDVWFALRLRGRAGGISVTARAALSSGGSAYAPVMCRWGTNSCGESDDYGCRLNFAPGELLQFTPMGSDSLPLALISERCAFADPIPGGCYSPMVEGANFNGILNHSGSAIYLRFRNYLPDTASVHAVWIGERENAVVGVSPPFSGKLAFSASPNPGRGGTKLLLALPRAGPVKIAVYDVSGRKVANVVDTKQLPAGNHAFPVEVSRAGVYLAQVRTLEGVRAQRLVVVN